MLSVVRGVSAFLFGWLVGDAIQGKIDSAHLSTYIVSMAGFLFTVVSVMYYEYKHRL